MSLKVWLASGLVCAAAATASAQPARDAKDGTGHGSNDASEHSRVDVRPSGHAFKQLDMDNPLGDITVEGYDGDGITVETWKYAPDEDSLDRLRVSLVPNPDGTVAIRTSVDAGREVKPVPKKAMRVDILIRAPRNTKINAASLSGKLKVKNMDAGSELDTASGEIVVDNVAGELSTHSVSGKTSIEQAYGPVDAATLDSDLDLDSISGEKLVASAAGGRIAGRRVRSRNIELTTSAGRIQLEAELALGGHVVVSSLHGDVDVRLRMHGQAQLRVHSAQKIEAGALALERQGEWARAMLGQLAQASDPMAMVELTSRFGNVQFAIVQ